MRRDLAIRVEGLGKRYRLGQQHRHFSSLREQLAAAATAPFRRLRGAAGGVDRPAGPETFWALKDVSFEVKHGEVVGVIGRNGAGKSTLLKVLTRITDPTAGRIELNGRVASLLEVGTGFHPELTGRENIYMNGAILGMTRAEIARKFDEIVAFAEVEQFLDTPVKRYSSGMYVRLAFAVAAHLEPEILLVDEVLAVGDVQFQRKCLGKMREVARGGRTVLFVSHNMGAVEKLCTRGLLLASGQRKAEGDIGEVITCYLQGLQSSIDIPISQRRKVDDNCPLFLRDIRLTDTNGSPLTRVLCGSDFYLHFEYECRISGAKGHFPTFIYNERGIKITRCDSYLTDGQYWHIAKGIGRAYVRFTRCALMPGQYFVNAAVICNGQRSDLVQSALSFTVEEGPFFSSGKLFKGDGLVLLDHNWEHEPASDLIFL